jgi:diacylglycerol kinase family enzyme
MKPYLAIINPAAGGGRCGKLAAKTLQALRSHGLAVDVVETRQPGDATRIARERYAQGFRRFLAGGGDGTSYEIVNGLFPHDIAEERVSLGFLPLGTGNSFLRDFADTGAEYAIQAVVAGRARGCDVIRLNTGTEFCTTST